MNTEETAIALGNNRTALHKEMLSYLGLLTKEIQKKFPRKRLVWDFDAKRLWGTEGYYLQWSIRENPLEPQSYDNQQTSRGATFCMQVKMHNGGVEPLDIAHIQIKQYYRQLEEMKIEPSEFMEYIQDCWHLLEDMPETCIKVSDLKEPEYQDRDADWNSRWRYRMALDYLVACAANERASMGKKGNFEYLWFVWE